MRACNHPPLDDFEVRGVARLCAPCLLRLHELTVGVPEASLFTGVPNRFISRAARDLALARCLGMIDPSPDDARQTAIAALVVATCDDECLDLADVLQRWTHGEPCGHASLDDALAMQRGDVDGLLGAVDRVIEVADA